MEKYKVLIVDDIPDNINTVTDMIKDFDLDVKTANGGKDAIELVDSFKPNIILLDLMMPGVNGWDVIDYVRSKYSKTDMAIIVVSLLSNKDNIDECYELGVNDYVIKPILKARLVSSLDAHLKNIARNANSSDNAPTNDNNSEDSAKMVHLG